VTLDGDDALRLRRGDAAGLAGLIARHQDRLFRYLRHFLGDESMAEDVFQQTWLRVAERIRRFDASRPFAPWLVAVARNLALDQLRRYRPESLDEAADVPPPMEPGPGTDDPLRQVAARERSERLAAAVAELPALDREVLALRFGEDLPLPDLAKTLGVPLPTAKARLYRALMRLRARLLARGPREDWA
jgi:RNA polymerase sigma-70 factor (ECF subfamily)